MDLLTKRHYSGMRHMIKAGDLYHDLHQGDALAKPLSNLDNARLKLSKYKLKYSKQEKQLHGDSPPSSTDLSSDEVSPAVTSIPKMLSKEPSENSNLVENTNVMSRGSENNESDSLVSVPDRKMKPVNSEYRHSPEVNLMNEKSVQSRDEVVSESDTSISEIHENVHSFSSLEIKSTRDEDFSLKPVEDNFVANSAIPAVILERRTSETSVSPITDTLESEHKVAQTEQNKLAPVATFQEMSNSVSSRAASERSTTRFPDKLPERVSSLSLASFEKKPKQRNVKVQTDRKRSRTVQVSLSEPCYENRIGPSCPILRASSLPKGLRMNDDQSENIAKDTESAARLLFNSQLKLTLNLLRREQALYVNCSRAAARLERGYKKHTLSETRQFIRQERKLRDEFRRNAD